MPKKSPSFHALFTLFLKMYYWPVYMCFHADVCVIIVRYSLSTE